MEDRGGPDRVRTEQIQRRRLSSEDIPEQAFALVLA